MKIQTLIPTLRRWFYDTPERALDQAYQAVLKIKAIEDEHFKGGKVCSDNNDNGDSALVLFRQQVAQQLKLAKVRLFEFQSSRSIITLSPLNNRNPNPPKPEENAIIIDKLNFIDQVIQRYEIDESRLQKQSVALISVNDSTPKVNNLMADDDSIIVNYQEDLEDLYETVNSRRQDKQKPDSMTEKTGVLPRSIFRTFDRIRQELDPKSQQAEVAEVSRFRKRRSQTAISIRFLLMLVIIPLLINQFSKTFVIAPIVQNKFYTETSTEIFINTDLEEEAYEELDHFKNILQMKRLVGLFPGLTDSEIEEQVKEKAKEITEESRQKSINALENVFADILSFFTFVIILLMSRREIAILRSFLDEVIYGLSDSAKAFLIILFTDIFVGYHSPHGWEILLEGVAKHLGIAESREFNYLFIATFPVILDTVLKYWIFRYLNRISPSAVATYRNMNE